MNYGQRFMTLYRGQGSRPSPWKRSKKAKWLSREALQIAVKRREAKSKGEKERYTHLLGESSSLSHCTVFLCFFASITEEGFLLSPCYSLELCIQMGISFLFSFAFCFSSFHRYLNLISSLSFGKAPLFYLYSWTTIPCFP